MRPNLPPRDDINVTPLMDAYLILLILVLVLTPIIRRFGAPPNVQKFINWLHGSHDWQRVRNGLMVLIMIAPLLGKGGGEVINWLKAKTGATQLPEAQ